MAWKSELDQLPSIAAGPIDRVAVMIRSLVERKSKARSTLREVAEIPSDAQIKGALRSTRNYHYVVYQEQP